VRANTPPQVLSKAECELEVEDDFSGSQLNDRLWIPYYLPHWSSRRAAAPRYALRDGALRLLIEADQPPWCPEFDGWLRVSSLQTGAFAGPLGTEIGQHHFRKDLVVREEQLSAALYTPRYGLFELRARAIDDPNNMVSLWMIGYEDEPQRSAEICVFEIFGREVKADRAKIGMGIHPFGDATIVDEFTKEDVAIDACDFHTYAVDWTPDYVAFYVDARLTKVVRQSPEYPMQFMLGIYEFADGPALRSRSDAYPKEFVVDWFRGYRALSTREPAIRRGRDIAADQ
jgi:glycosyl hydrolase family 16